MKRWLASMLLAVALLAMGAPAWSQETDLADASLPTELSWKAVKLETIVEPPYGIPAVEVGIGIDGTMAVEATCTGDVCVYQSQINIWPQTPSEPTPSVAWEQAGASWTLDGRGYFVSASYPDGDTCIYEVTEIWDVAVVDGVFDGSSVVATRLVGEFVRGEALDPGRSTPSAVADGTCPAFNAVDRWSVVATADVEPVVEVTAGDEPGTTIPEIPPSTIEVIEDPTPIAVEPEGPGIALVVLIAAVLAVLALGGGVFFAGFFTDWIPESIYGRSGCTAGATQGCTIEEVFFCPYDQLGQEEKFAANLADVRNSAIALTAITAIINPQGAAAAAPLTGARMAQSATLSEQLRDVNHQGLDRIVEGYGYDVYARISWQCCTSALITGNYWKECSTVTLVPPPDSNYAHIEPVNSGWHAHLLGSQQMLDRLAQEIQAVADVHCGGCC